MLMQNYSLRTKLVWSALLCFLIPLIIIYLVTTYFTKDIIVEKAVENAKDTLEVAKTQIDGIFEQALQLSNFVIMSNDVRKMLNERLHEEAASRDSHVNLLSVNRLLDDLFLFHDDLNVTIIGENGFKYTSYSHSDLNPDVYLEKSWFDSLRIMPVLSAVWISEQDYYKKNIGNWITVARPIKRTGNPMLGSIIININEQSIRKHLKFSESQQMMLIDSDGVIASHPDPSLIGERLSELSHEGSNDILFINGKKNIYIEQQLDSNQWKTVSLIPYEEAIAKNNQVLFISFTVQGLFFSLFFVLLIILISAIMRPIGELSRFVTNIGRGQLDARNGIRGNHEVGRLARTIDQMLDRIQMMFEQIVTEQGKKRKAELEMLQAQINPHFMFNLLNSIRLNILTKGDKENAQLISSLSSLLRMTINRDNEYITLQEEAETVEHYVKLMNFRHANQVVLQLKFVDGAEHIYIPRFMLQPIIENCIIHGFEQYNGEIIIEAELEQKLQDEPYIRIRVRDNGKGMTSDKLIALQRKIGDQFAEDEQVTSGFSGIGVTNVVQRLRLIYGAKFEVNLFSETDVGTTIEFMFPTQPGNAGEKYVESNSSR